MILEIISLLILVSVVLSFIEHILERDVFGPYLSNTQHTELRKTVLKMLHKGEFSLSFNKKHDEILHADIEARHKGVNYLAYNEGKFTTSSFYVLCVSENGESKNYRIREGERLFDEVRAYHYNKLQQR